MSDPIGATLIRLLADDVSMREVRLVLKRLRDDPSLRERASTIGTLVDADEATRLKCCNDMIDIMLSWIEPIDQQGSNPVLDAQRYVRMGNRALGEKFLKPLLKTNSWYHHVKRTGSKLYTSINKGECYITIELYDVLVAIEELWGQQRLYTVASREMTSVEYQQQIMAAELSNRGSKFSK